MIETKTLLTVAVIAGAMLLVAGTSIEMAFAAANQGAPGQNFRSVVPSNDHRNPSGGALPPGQAPLPPGPGPGGGNSGQCQKGLGGHTSLCHPKLP